MTERSAPEILAAGVQSGLAAPLGLRTQEGRGHVTLSWDAVPGALGYQVYRADARDAPFRRLGPGGRPVPHPPYVDASGEPDRPYHYVVAAVSELGAAGRQTAPVIGAATVDHQAAARIRVDAGAVVGRLVRPWRRMIGAGPLGALLDQPTAGTWSHGPDLAAALRAAHVELGVSTVRVPAVLGDDLGVYAEAQGRVMHDFRALDQLLDAVLDTGLRPVLELAGTPAQLARDARHVGPDGRSVVSPPRDLDRWSDLIHDLAAHVVGRFGVADVRARWAFQVWHDADLDRWWAGSQEEFLQLYDVTARAVKSADAGVRVGASVSAHAAFTGPLLDHAAMSGAPVDFLAAHGTPLLDPRPLCARYGRSDLGVVWSERDPAEAGGTDGDLVLGAAQSLGTMRAAVGRIGAVSPGPITDTPGPTVLFHGGNGLFSIGNLRKPRYWALAMADRLGDGELVVTMAGDGVGGLVNCWAAQHAVGAVGVLVWSGLLEPPPSDEAARLLDRRVTLDVTGLASPAYKLQHWRVDDAHSNVRVIWQSLGSGWPTAEEWAILRTSNTLDEMHPPRQERALSGVISIGFDLPMPAISYLELTPLR